jgi:hypothetical protein
MRKCIAFGLLTLALAIGAVGCSGAPSEPPTPPEEGPAAGEEQPAATEEPSESEPEAEPTESAPPVEMPAEVTVESIAIDRLESQPVQFVAVVSGVVTEPCLDVIDAYQVADGLTLYLEPVTASTGQSDCPEPPVPFEISIYLDPGLLTPGAWTVVAGEATAALDISEADLGAPSPEETGAEGGSEPGKIMMYDLAMVDSVTPLVRQGPPVQVELLIQGNLNDGCTELDGVLQQGQGTTDIVVYLQTQRPEDAMCTEALVPFDTTIQLEGDFPPGDYTVTVNDEVGATFTVE